MSAEGGRGVGRQEEVVLAPGEAFWEGRAHESVFESSGKEPAERVGLNPRRGVKLSGLEEKEGLALVGRRHPSSSV